MRHTLSALTIATVTLTACPATGPASPGGATTGQTIGTMTVPAETNPAIAVAPLTAVQLATGALFGLPAYAAALDGSVVAQFQATIDGKPCPVTWDRITTTAAGETQAQFTIHNSFAANRAELVLSSPSQSVKLGTWIERADPQTTTTLQTDVSARSTAGLLICRSIAANGGKAENQYAQADFQAVVDNPKTAEVETSFKSALSTSTRGQDTWANATLAQVTLNAASEVSAALNLGAKINLNLGGSTTGGNANVSTGGTISLGQ